MSEAKNIFYAQSGGVTAVINASACGVIETARKNKHKIGTVYAGQSGLGLSQITLRQVHFSEMAAPSFLGL